MHTSATRGPPPCRAAASATSASLCARRFPVSRKSSDSRPTPAASPRPRAGIFPPSANTCGPRSKAVTNTCSTRRGSPDSGSTSPRNAAVDVLRAERLERAIGVVYLPQSELRSHCFHASMPGQFDAVVHIDRTRAVEPLERTSAWRTDEAPETFPAGV
ncbi:MAG: erythromycin esterase family protein [Verrucomicrobia bacterium]|nr:erythromycin esterase family protein [Verrucomicrobiota bacterium]